MFVIFVNLVFIIREEIESSNIILRYAIQEYIDRFYDLLYPYVNNNLFDEIRADQDGLKVIL